MLMPMMIQTTSPMMTNAEPQGAGPLELLAVAKLWAKPAPAIIPRTKMAASPSPSPERKSCLPGHPPASAKASPASTIPPKFQRWLVWATGCPLKPGWNWLKMMLVMKAPITSPVTPVIR